MPKASGKVLGITCASQAGSRSGRSSCSSRPVKWIRSAAPGAAASQSSSHAGSRNDVQVAQRAGRPALELAAARGDLAQVVDVGRARSASTKRPSASR